MILSAKRQRLWRLMSKQMPVDIVVNGELPEGVYLSEPQISGEKITVSGPASLVKRVAAVRAFVSVEDVQKAEPLRVRVAAYDANGEGVRGVTINTAEVTVSYTMHGAKQVPVMVDITGVPAAGHKIGEVTSSPQSVELIGANEALDKITALQLESIDISGRTLTLTRNYRLADYLPEGVRVKEGTEENVRIVVEIGQQESREVILQPEQLEILGQEDGLEYRLENSVTLIVSGEQEALDALQPETLQGTVNAAGLSEGTHTAIVHVELPEGLTAGLTYANISISAAAAEEPPEQQDEPAGEE